MAYCHDDSGERLKRPSDPVQLDKLIGDILPGQVEGRFSTTIWRNHQTLKITPAMAVELTPKLWEISDMVMVLEKLEAVRNAR